MEKPEHDFIAIVSFNSLDGMVARTTYYQVSISPRHVSPDGKYIRFGDVSGDEIVGWVELDELDIHSVLFDYEQEPLHYSNMDVGMQLLGRLTSERLDNQRKLEVVDGRKN